MSKFVIECPYCGAYNQASNSFFSRKTINCSCGRIIDIRNNKLKSIECPHCKNVVVYDQSKLDKAICPICKEKLISDNTYLNTATIKCPTCLCDLVVDKNASSYTCPLCETNINVQEQIKKQELKEKGIISLIKYEGPNDVFIWKHPIEDFNLGSQLIVHESQEAIFFKDGKALDTFSAGRYTLLTENVPILNELYKPNLNNMFHSEVYFINLVTQMGIKWGTDSKVRLFDPVSGLHIEIGACGQFNIRVVNGRKLLLKVVGTTNGLTQDDLICNDYSFKEMTGKFKALIISKVKTFLAKIIKENSINILEIDEHIEEISLVLKDKINLALDEYGLNIPEFFITSIMTPDDDPNYKKMKEQYAERYLLIQQERIKKAEAEASQQRKIVEAQTSAQEKIIAAQADAEMYRLKAEAEAQEMRMKGYTYQQETQRKVAMSAMEHQANGLSGDTIGIVNNMVGVGVGLGVATEVAHNVKDAINPIISNKNDEWECPNCHCKSSTPFCPNCGEKRQVINSGWTCPNCGQKDIKTPFCPFCGTKKVEKTTWDCICGQKNIETPFCPICGRKKGE